MSGRPRVFSYVGDEESYVSYLESQLMMALCMLGQPNPPEALMITDDVVSQGSPSPNSIQFVQCHPHLDTRSRDVPDRKPAKWKRQLEGFICSIPSEATWDDARIKAGIHTKARNQTALRLMLGHVTEASPNENKSRAMISHATHAEHKGLVLRGYRYADFINSCADDRNFAVSVVAFQKLIFVSYCEVMLQSGIPRDTTDNMMRHYFHQSNDGKHLEGYRHGALWVNRCIAALLANGWGHKSWEIFLLECRSPAQFARFAANEKRSYAQVADRLGRATVPVIEDGWIPYCIPCIVQQLAGDAVGLEQICNILGYGTLNESSVLQISTFFTESTRCITYELAQPLIPNHCSIRPHEF